jgi:enterochelin esterase-like enzyme
MSGRLLPWRAGHAARARPRAHRTRPIDGPPPCVGSARRPRSRSRWATRVARRAAACGATLLLLVGVVAAVPPWREEALAAVLLATGELGVPAALPSVTLCSASRRHPGGAPRRVVPPGRVVAGTLASPAIGGRGRPYYIYLPPGYDLPALRQVRYPVVYLLHGSPGQARDWYAGGKINRVADHLIASCRLAPTILVLPDGNGGLGRDSEYIDRWDGRERDDAYIARDVVGYVDRHLRTRPNPRYRALLGLSEGGYGAANLVVRHPDVFGAAVAIAGYFRASPAEVPPWDQRDDPYGPPGRNDALLRANSPLLRVATLPPPVRHRLHIFLYDGADDRAYGPAARAFARQLARSGVPYVWDTQRDPLPVWPYHNWPYWRRAGADALVRLSALFSAPPP